MTVSDSTAAPVTVRMLDTSQGHTLQQWTFTDTAAITIGRAEEQSVVIGDPYVSRLHAELLRREEGWWLVSRGRHGVLVDGQPIDEVPICSNQTFRLGPNGPTLQFCDQPQTARNVTTITNFDADSMIVLQLDQQQLAREVSEVSSNDYFQQLQQRMRDLRRQRPAR